MHLLLQMRYQTAGSTHLESGNGYIITVLACYTVKVQHRDFVSNSTMVTVVQAAVGSLGRLGYIILLVISFYLKICTRTRVGTGAVYRQKNLQETGNLHEQ